MTEPRTGERALIEALKKCDVALVTGVYGDPCTSLLDLMRSEELAVEVSVEEKTALSQALGASVVGKRAVMAAKQVGINVAADPLVTAATHGIGAGVLVICGDDPGAAKSQNEEDSRWYAKLMELPLIVPHDPQTLADGAVEGLSLSEELGVPVLMQITGRLTRMTGPVALPPPLGPAPSFRRERAWSRFILERHKYHLQEIWPKLQDRVEGSKLHRVQKGENAREGVISCGYVSSLVEHENHLVLGYAHPLPEHLIVKFLEGLERVLIVEEIAPFVEEGVRALVGAHRLGVEVLGRLSGHLPRVGQLEREHIAKAFALTPEGWNFDVKMQLSDTLQTVPCGGFEPLYQALAEVLPSGYPVAGDVGCSILHGYFPPQVVTTAYALGTSIGTAAGMSLSGQKGVALIGDTGFLHSGITGLLNAVEFQHNVLVIVLYNRISAMTPGEQDIKGIERLKQLIEACGPTAIDEVDVDGASPEELRALLEKRLGERGVHVVIAKAQPRPFGMAIG